MGDDIFGEPNLYEKANIYDTRTDMWYNGLNRIKNGYDARFSVNLAQVFAMGGIAAIYSHVSHQLDLYKCIVVPVSILGPGHYMPDFDNAEILRNYVEHLLD